MPGGAHRIPPMKSVFSFTIRYDDTIRCIDSWRHGQCLLAMPYGLLVNIILFLVSCSWTTPRHWCFSMSMWGVFPVPDDLIQKPVFIQSNLCPCAHVFDSNHYLSTLGDNGVIEWLLQKVDKSLPRFF